MFYKSWRAAVEVTKRERELNMTWPMKTDPDGGKRGACVECQRSETVDQVLTSVTVPGRSTGVAVCSQCVTLPKYAKHLK